jgi:hypothetical protein
MDKSLLHTTLRTKAGARRLHQNYFYERMRLRKEEDERRRREGSLVPLKFIEFMACGHHKDGFGCSDADISLGGQDTKISSLSGLDVVEKEIERLEAARVQAQLQLDESEAQLRLLQKAKHGRTPQQPPPSITSPSKVAATSLPTQMSLHHAARARATHSSNDGLETTEGVHRRNDESGGNAGKRLFTLERQVINLKGRSHQQILLNNQDDAHVADGLSAKLEKREECTGTVIMESSDDITPQIWSPTLQASLQHKNQAYRELTRPMEESIELLRAPTAEDDLASATPAEPCLKRCPSSQECDLESSDNSILVTVVEKLSNELEVELPRRNPDSSVRKGEKSPLVKADDNSRPSNTSKDALEQKRPNQRHVAALVDLDSGCDETATIVDPIESTVLSPPATSSRPQYFVPEKSEAAEVTCPATRVSAVVAPEDDRESNRLQGADSTNHIEGRKEQSNAMTEHDVPMVQGISFHSVLSESQVVVKGEPVSPNTVSIHSIVHSAGENLQIPLLSKKPGTSSCDGMNPTEGCPSVSSLHQQRSIRSQRSNRIEETRAAFDNETERSKAPATCSVQLTSMQSKLSVHSHLSSPSAAIERESVVVDSEEESLPPSPRHVATESTASDPGNSEYWQCRVEERQDETIARRYPRIRDGTNDEPAASPHALSSSVRPTSESFHSPASRKSTASQLFQHQLYAVKSKSKKPMKPKEREFNKLKNLLDRIDYHHHQLHHGTPGSSDEVAGLVVAFGAPKNHSSRSRASQRSNHLSVQPLDPPSSSFELALRHHHKLCESPPSGSADRTARLETLRRNLDTLDDQKQVASAKYHIPSKEQVRSRRIARHQPFDAPPMISPRRGTKETILSPTTTDDWDLLMQVRAAILGGDTSPIFGSESERVVLWPSL